MGFYIITTNSVIIYLWLILIDFEGPLSFVFICTSLQLVAHTTHFLRVALVLLGTPELSTYCLFFLMDMYDVLIIIFVFLSQPHNSEYFEVEDRARVLYSTVRQNKPYLITAHHDEFTALYINPLKLYWPMRKLRVSM